MDDNLDLEYDRLLGEGSYGKVFLVRQQDGQQFAVKEIDLGKCEDDGREQALAEATLLSRVKHENILKYIESVMNDDCLYIITEFCGGGDLEDYLEAVQRAGLTVPEPLVSEWVLQIGSALKYLHDMRILHRDMKSKNIFLKDDLTVKLGDLGIAKVLDLNQSKANTFIGTPSYMSPELFTGKPYNHKTDIWGLGCCAYEMLTLKRAFQGKALWTLIKEIKNGKELDLPDEYSLNLRALIADMMNQSPESRPSAKDIVDNEYLLYHRGTAKTVVSHLPKPNKKEEKKKTLTRNSANLSGSFDRMLRQKNKSEDDRLRRSLASISIKVNTLRGTLQTEDEGEGEMSTFVYHGNGDSDEELEASNTILDSSTLKQYTQHLDTFVYKGGDSDSDSDYDTGSMGRNKGLGDQGDTINRTLIAQYSETLEEMEHDSADEDGDNHHEVHNVSDNDDGGSVDVPDSRIVTNKSTLRQSTRMDETLTSRYSKFNGLQDTLALNDGKSFRRNSSDTSGSAMNKHRESTKSSESGSKQKKSDKLSASFSGAKTLYEGQSSDFKGHNPKLNRTISSDGESKINQAKLKTCHRLEQSFLNKSLPSKSLKSAKKAFNEEDVKPSGDLDVSGVISHLKENLTLYTDETEFISEVKGQGRNVDEVFDEQGSPRRRGKKKEAYIKREAAKKRSSESENDKVNVSASTDKNVTLFTRAQAVSYNKESDVPQVNGGQSMLQHIVQLMTEGETNKLNTEHLVYIHSELTKAVGIDSLKQVLDIMSMVQSEEELKLHLENVLGPAMYKEYKVHLQVLHRLEVRDIAVGST